ncbi:MAG: DUF411 domain-containing protein [Aquificota bacterium]|nr:MAG: DUF411 domain-containing protein [Aquificota bacterium]
MKKFLCAMLFIPFIVFSKEEITAYYNPGCGCCTSYFSRLEKEGFRLKKVKVSGEELMKIKSRLGVPPELRSCHTMVYGGRFIEGHVPPEGVRLVLKDKSVKGTASPHGQKSAKGQYEDSYRVVR